MLNNEIDYKNEEWKLIQGYNNSLEISNYGRLRKNVTKRICKLKIRNNEYYFPYNIGTTMSHLVARYFVLEDSNTKIADIEFIDGNSLNIHKDNLKIIEKQMSDSHKLIMSKVGKKRSKPIIGLVDDLEIYRFDSSYEAERALNIAQQSINISCHDNTKSAGKYNGKKIYWVFDKVFY